MVFLHDNRGIERVRLEMRFTIFGATPQRDSAAIGFSPRALINDATKFYARYDGEVGGGTDNHAITAGLRMRWWEIA